MTDRLSPESGPDVFTTYNDLPEAVRSHLQELEMFIGECDGQWTALQTSDANVVLDNGTIDASDAVKAFNGIVAAFRGLAQCSKVTELPPLADRAELVALLEDLASINMTPEACRRQAERMADDLIARGLSFSSTDRPGNRFCPKDDCPYPDCLVEGGICGDLVDSSPVRESDK